MTDRHLQAPGNPGPKSERGEECRGKAQIVFDEEGADDAREIPKSVATYTMSGGRYESRISRPRERMLRSIQAASGFNVRRGQMATAPFE